MCLAGEGGGKGRLALLAPAEWPFAGDGEARNGEATRNGDGRKGEEEEEGRKGEDL